jgi:hypothetical protein
MTGSKPAGKNEGTKMMKTVAKALVAGVVALGLASVPGSATADSAPAVATFAKYIADGDFPNFPWDMLGTVGGAVGNGTYNGEVLEFADDGSNQTIHALYHLHGSKHDFTADMHWVVSDSTGQAHGVGTVTSGWRKGASVIGFFQVNSPCPFATPGNSLGDVCMIGNLSVGESH